MASEHCGMSGQSGGNVGEDGRGRPAADCQGWADLGRSGIWSSRTAGGVSGAQQQPQNSG